MNTQLVNEAFFLFVETLPLESMDFDNPKFMELYEKECQMFTLLRQFNEEDGIEYRKRIAEFNNDRG